MLAQLAQREREPSSALSYGRLCTGCQYARQPVLGGDCKTIVTSIFLQRLLAECRVVWKDDNLCMIGRQHAGDKATALQAWTVLELLQL
jgi:hypothetical protein